jgi:hypothetical protein
MGAYIAAGMVEFAGDAAISRLVVPEAPLWYQLAFLIVGPLASLAGGTLLAAGKKLGLK